LANDIDIVVILVEEVVDTAFTQPTTRLFAQGAVGLSIWILQGDSQWGVAMGV